jgi:hypothetical protein
MREKYCYMDKTRRCDETCACLQVFDGAWSCSALRGRVTPSSTEEVNDGVE